MYVNIVVESKVYEKYKEIADRNGIKLGKLNEKLFDQIIKDYIKKNEK